MKFIKDVQSTVYPKLEDIDSSSTTKYIRGNVREELVKIGKPDTEEYQEYIMYIYDEYQYTTEEFCLLKINEFNSLRQELNEMKVAMTSLLSIKDGE